MYTSHFLAFVTIVIVGSAVYDEARGGIISKCRFDARCRCQAVTGTAMVKADCSNQDLNAIPNFPNNIVEMDLNRNRIKLIEDSTFLNNSRLLKLDLSYNSLSNLSGLSFAGLYNLRILFISNNNIQEVESDTFSNIRGLKELNFKTNPFNSLNLNLNYTFSLDTLKLDFLPNENPRHKRFWRLHNLRTLDVSGISGKCNVKTLTEETFELLPQLESINLSACSINYIHKGTFRKLGNLTFLDVSFNRCLKFTGVENIIFDLPYTSIKVLKINKVHQTFELNTKVTVSNFENLFHTNLTELHIDSNRIQLFERGALTKLPPTLHFVSAADNQFSYGDYFKDIHRLPVHFANLSSLFASHDPREKSESCDIFHQSNKPLGTYDNQVHNSSNSPVVDEIGRNVSDPPLFMVPQNMTSLIYTHCNLRYEIPLLFISANKIEYINASFNIFYSWVGPLVSLNNLKYLDLSNNFCTNVSKDFFLTFKNLKSLFVQNNLLGFVLPDDTEGEILQHVPKLEVINLSSNKIPALPQNFFRTQKQLKKLYINNNMLDNITFEICHMTYLSYLDLSNNRLSSLNDYVTDQLEAIITQSPNLIVDLSGNHLQCTCDTINFVEWITKTKIRLYNLRQTNCYLRNNSMINLKKAAFLHSFLKRECSSYTSLIIGMVALVVLFTSVLIWGLIYRHRWKIRYLYYMIKSKHQGVIKTPVNADHNIYEYDAFISYADKDSKFVHTKVIDNLEKEAGLRLCIHKRDFLPGNDIAANITGAIHASRKTVVIMSHHYLESDWCMFEYNMAKMESIYARDKENILFLVFMEQMVPKQLPLHILELVQSQSYIEFPDDPYGDTVFWEKLRQVLSS